MGIGLGWERYIGQDGEAISIETYGASGTGTEVMNWFGFTAQHVVDRVKNILQVQVK